jgi:serine/threonine protein kinase
VYDFGLARVLDEHTPQVNEDCGSLGYTAPELLKRQPYGVEVDMFSSGVIIFFILSGYRPFNVPGAGRAEVKSRIINCEYTFDLQRWSRVSAEAQSLVRGLLVPRDERLKASDSVDHPWLQEDEATRFNLESHNLNQNATYIEVGVAEPAHSYHSAAYVSYFGKRVMKQNSCLDVPLRSYVSLSLLQTIAVHVDPVIQNILTQIRSDRIGGSHYSFTANEHVNAVPLVDYVAQSSEPYTERQCRLLFFKLFRAVETLHQRNVVHRSLRREHIYVQVSGIVLGYLHELD